MYRILLLCCLTLLLSCSSDDDARANEFLVDVGFVMDLNTNLPQYSALNFPGNFIIVPSAGLRGVLVYSINASNYLAYELSDPNHSPNGCSMMTVSGITATCPCPDDNNSYQITNGAPFNDTARYPMKAYRASRQGDVVRITN